MMKNVKNVFTNTKRLTWLLALALAFIIGLIPCFLHPGSGKGGTLTLLSEEEKPVLSHKVTNPAAENSSEEPPEHHTIFGNLAADGNYLFALVNNANTSQILADDNLYFVDQEKVDEKGELSFDYIPRSYSKATACLFGEVGFNMTELTWFISGNQLTVAGNGLTGSYSSAEQSPWFSSRNSVQSIEIQDGITKLGKYAFSSCSSLSSVSIPETVTDVSNNAFSGCSKLNEVTILGIDTKIESSALPLNSNLIIKGHAGSKAEAYANAKGLKFIDLDAPDALLGDVDGDGTVTIIDATFIQRKLASIPIPFDFNDKIADTDDDGSVSIIDATYIQRWLAGLKSNDNIGKPNS